LCFIKKIRKKSLDNVTFAEFDRNLNFIHDVVARLRNKENCIRCWMDFVRNEIINSLPPLFFLTIFYIKIKLDQPITWYNYINCITPLISAWKRTFDIAFVYTF